MSVKPCSSSKPISYSALSTSASAVGRPYLATSFLSSEPAFTPMRIGMLALLGRVGHLFDVLGIAHVAGVQPQPVHAGLDRHQCQAHGEVDVGDDRHAALARRWSGSASASPSWGTATRTMSAPCVASSCTWISVASTSSVFVAVIDWIDMGAPPPTATFPTLIVGSCVSRTYVQCRGPETSRP